MKTPNIKTSKGDLLIRFFITMTFAVIFPILCIFSAPLYWMSWLFLLINPILVTIAVSYFIRENAKGLFILQLSDLFALAFITQCMFNKVWNLILFHFSELTAFDTIPLCCFLALLISTVIVALDRTKNLKNVAPHGDEKGKS